MSAQVLYENNARMHAIPQPEKEEAELMAESLFSQIDFHIWSLIKNRHISKPLECIYFRFAKL